MPRLRDRLQSRRLRLRLGAASLILASLAHWYLASTAPPWRDVTDAATGMLYGIAIAFMLLSLRSGPRCQTPL